MTTAMTLASNVREMSLGMAFFDPDQPAAGPHTWDSREATVLAYDNVTDLDGTVDTWDKPEDAAGWQKFSPPIDGTRKGVAGYANWAQYVKVETVGPGQIRTVLPQDPEAEAARVTVKITKDNKELYRSSWVIFAPLAKNP